MTDRAEVPRVRVAVSAPVDAHLVAPALRARLAGAAWPIGPERQVADAVLRAVADANTDPKGEPWR